MGALDRVRRGLLLERGEGGAVASGALASALVLLAYGLLKPARDAIFTAEGQGGELLWNARAIRVSVGQRTAASRDQ